MTALARLSNEDKFALPKNEGVVDFSIPPLASYTFRKFGNPKLPTALTEQGSSSMYTTLVTGADFATTGEGLGWHSMVYVGSARAFDSHHSLDMETYLPLLHFSPETLRNQIHTNLNYSARPASAGLDIASISPVDKREAIAVKAVDDLWSTHQIDEEESSTRFISEIEKIIIQYSHFGVRAIGARISGTPVPSEREWKTLEALATVTDSSTFVGRIRVLQEALEHRDPATRYSAVGAIVQASGRESKRILSRRLVYEKNLSVQALIEAYLQ